MVLVKALRAVVHGHAAVQHHVHAALVRTHLESVHVARGLHSVDESVGVGHAVLIYNRNVVGETAVLLEERVVSVVRVMICAASEEVEAGTYCQGERISVLST